MLIIYKFIHVVDLSITRFQKDREESMRDEIWPLQVHIDNLHPFNGAVFSHDASVVNENSELPKGLSNFSRGLRLRWKELVTSIWTAGGTEFAIVRQTLLLS